MDMCTGDLYTVDGYHGAAVAGVVTKTADDKGWFEGLEMAVNTRTGKLLGLSYVSRHEEAKTVRKVLPLPAVEAGVPAPAVGVSVVGASSGPMADVVDRVIGAMSEGTKVVPCGAMVTLSARERWPR